MTVLTISREIGSGGGEIAQNVAEALGYQLIDKQTIERVLLEYGFAQFREEYDNPPSFWSRFNSVQEQMVEMLDRVIQAFAQRGDVVILGRGSFAVLSGLEDVLNVRIQAPTKLRAERLMQAETIADYAEAESRIAESDDLRRTFIQLWYQTRWDDATAFDLVINTGKASPALAVEWILEANQAAADHRRAGALSVRDLPVDAILAETVAEMLGGSILA